MQEPGLCEIALGGFETFAELTRIPIGRLTFLFGPNSAGKSSVEEGIRLLSESCDTGESDPGEKRTVSFESDRISRQSRLNRVWRRTGEGPDSYANLMQIGASALIDVSRGDLIEDVTNIDDGTYNPMSPELQILEVIIQYRDRDRRTQWSPKKSLNYVLRDIAFLLNGVPFLEFTDHAEAALNFNHPLFIHLPIPDECRAAERVLPSCVSTTDGWLRFRGGMVYDDQKRLDQWMYQMAWLWRETDGLEAEQMLALPPEVAKALGCFAEIFDKVLRNSCRTICETLTPFTVPASRRTPEARELSFLLGGGESLHDHDHSAFHITMHSDPCYRALAWSFAGRGEIAASRYGGEQRESIHFLVNRMLTDHLFSERGYRLVAKRRVLVDDHAQEGSTDPKRGVSVLVAMRLADSQGREYEFTEVGSGLGYVLPVLAAACNESLPLVILQQPELHLHPALQAALGDVFVELSHSARRQVTETTNDGFLLRGGRRLVIETHSEHLLLRVLKRLRQTGNGTGNNPELHLEPDDVAILYFDPHPDGTTKVKRLRVSADGEFLDRWPRGFFTERDADLFDE